MNMYTYVYNKYKQSGWLLVILIQHTPNGGTSISKGIASIIDGCTVT